MAGRDYVTRMGSLHDFTKGGVQIISGDPRHYAFSNIFEVARSSMPWEAVAVAKNMEYVLEVVRAEGQSGWRSSRHDQTALVMDGTATVHLVKPADEVSGSPSGSFALPGEPPGQTMGRVTASRGHLVLLPARAAYQITSEHPAVLLVQTKRGPDTIERWAEICQSA
ncbi:MAG: hydroxyquinol 1,2-dioxygenase [Acidimicrobiales bacterium]